jgi:integrase
MPSLRRSANSPFWIACFTLPDGSRTNRSTKTTDRRLAQRLADEWQTASDKARQNQFCETQARLVLNDILARAGQPRMKSETVESFLRRWLASKNNAGTAKRYASTVQSFLKHLATKKQVDLTGIGHEDILSFIQHREAEGVAPKTISVDVRTLSAAFNFARKLALIVNNPVERALAIRPILVQSSQRNCFSSEQVAELFKSAEGEWKTMILLGYYTGARLSDCANMRWNHVNLTHGTIEFVPQKTRRKNYRLVVPIHPQLLKHVDHLAAFDKPQEYLCSGLAGTRSGGKNGLSTRFKRLMAKAGIDEGSVRGKGIRQFAKLSFHSLRHSFNSTMANAGVDQETRMKLTGHSDKAVNSAYTHLDLSKLRFAVEKLSSVSLA